VAEIPENEKAVYVKFSELSRFIKEGLRQQGLASGEVSRCNQYLSKMIIAFESVKHIYQYRTCGWLNKVLSLSQPVRAQSRS
jgi:prolipoprotein diacylglyceryltransferase